MNFLFLLLVLPLVYSIAVPGCGKRAASCPEASGSRITGGEDTCAEMEPWHALINFKGKNLQCGGVLITERHVLSAAHCFHNNNRCLERYYSYTYEACKNNIGCTKSDCIRFGVHDVQVYLGVTDSRKSGYGKLRNLEKLDIHPGWVMDTRENGITQGHDLAVLTLKTYVKLECYLTINPICYPYAPKQSVIGKTAFIFGFGLKKSGTATTRLQKANVQITTQRCDEWNLRGNQLCALGNRIGNQRLADTCNGDSGGGLIISDYTTDRYFLVGITSFGEEDCGNTDSRPGVYTNVYDHKDWIEDMIKENGSDNKCALRSGPDMPPQEPVAVKTTVILLGGRKGGKTESYPCDVAIGDIGFLDGLGAAVLNGQIVYCGGFDGDIRSNCFKNEGMDWIEFESMNVSRVHFTLTTLGDKILAAGGFTGQGYTAIVEVFDGSSWKLQNYELTSARDSHCAVPISESQVMLIGGSSNSNFLSLVEVYSIEEGFIAELTSMPTARWGLACSMFKGEIWTAGGYNGIDLDLDVVEVLTPFTNTWRNGPRLTRKRVFLTMEVLDNNLVVFGGYEGEDSLLILEGEDWREEPLQYEHADHASVSIPCN